MINGVKLSQIALVNQRKKHHYKKLQKIIQRNKTEFTEFDQNTKQASINKRKFHDRSVQFSRERHREQLNRCNQALFERLVGIFNRKNQYSFCHDANSLTSKAKYQNDKTDPSQSKKVRHRSTPSKRTNKFSYKPSSFFQRQKMRQTIIKQNPQIAKRLYRKTAEISFRKQLEEYKRTQKISHRLQKFPLIDRLTKGGSSKTVPMRIKTLPANINSSDSSNTLL